MMHLLVGRFNPDMRDEHRAAVQAEFNEHLMQMHPKVKLAGLLKDDTGRWIGHVIVVDAQDADEARRYASEAPTTGLISTRASRRCVSISWAGNSDER